MGRPSVIDYAPTNLGPRHATYKAKCYPNGGFPCKLKFYSVSHPGYHYHISKLFDITEEGQIVEWTNTDLSYLSACWYHSHIENPDGLDWTKARQFWLPIPSSLNVGSPFLVTTKVGSFTDYVYNVLLNTDVACTLHLLVDRKKPWVSPSFHITHGVVFHHDPELYFAWTKRVDQHETGDVTTHTFAIPFTNEDVKYYYIALGSVDGKDSPSVSPVFWFMRYSVPTMRVNDTGGITATTAEIWGWLYKDKGAPAYVRMRYTKTDLYTHYTPIMGPWPSQAFWNEHLTDLTPDTEYKFSSIGSHDLSMTRYGWSQPKYFRTALPPYGPEQEYICPISVTSVYYYTHELSWTAAREGDPYIYEIKGGIKTGLHHFQIYYELSRGLVGFDTSGIPIGSKVNSAYFLIYGKTSYSTGGDLYPSTVCLVNAAGWPGSFDYSWYHWLMSQNEIISSLYYPIYFAYRWRNWYVLPDKLSFITPGSDVRIGTRALRDIENTDIGFNSYEVNLSAGRLHPATLHVFAQPPLI